MAATDTELYARSFADVYDEWYGDLDDPGHLVGALTDRCPPNPVVLELGSGTGRLAHPLHDAACRVIALDSSVPMLVQSSVGPHGVASDMAELPLRASGVDAVLVAYNTFFNLAGINQQQQCLSEAARVLRPGGLLALEAFVAPGDASSQASAEFGITIKDHPTDRGRQLAILTGPDKDDPGLIVGSHIELGTRTTCRPWQLRYQSPADLDVAAAAADLRLHERFSAWDGTPFDDESDRHVSWYKRI